MPEVFASPGRLIRRDIHSLESLANLLRETADWLDKEIPNEENIYGIEIQTDFEGTGVHAIVSLKED